MIKFTFITLMMILGMSSVSFGKSYLCITERGLFILPDENWLMDKKKGLDKNKILVKTEGNNKKMISVKYFGDDVNYCMVGKVIIQKGIVISGVGESIKGGDYLTCRQPETSSEGGFTGVEFNLNIRTRVFNLYTMSLKRNLRLGMSIFGKCEEI